MALVFTTVRGSAQEPVSNASQTLSGVVYKFLQKLSQVRRHFLFAKNLLPILNQSVESFKSDDTGPLGYTTAGRNKGCSSHDNKERGSHVLCYGPPAVPQRKRASRIKNNKTRKRRKHNERRGKWT